jgi:anti-anti-sigma factor
MTGGFHGAGDLSVTETVDGIAVRLLVTGEVDLATGQTFRTALAAAQDKRPASLVVDLGGVTFLDSTGINALIRAYKRAVVDGTTVTVVNCQPSVRRTFEVTGVWKILTGDGPPR